MQAGYFVKDCCHLLRRICYFDASPPPNLTKSDLCSLFITIDNSKPTKETNLFVDEGVYSKNRNFRIWKSSKIGKNVYLERLDYDEISENLKPATAEVSELSDDEFEFFRDSLVCAITEEELANKITVVKTDNQNISTYLDGVSIEFSKSASGGLVKSFSESSVVSANSEVDGVDCKPLTDFMLSWINNFGSKRGKIAKIVYFPSGNCLLISVLNNRFCFNVNREHKSNGIYLFAEFSRNKFSQRCYDPDCKYFRSFEQDIPNELIPQDYVNEFVESGSSCGSSSSRKSGASSCNSSIGSEIEKLSDSLQSVSISGSGSYSEKSGMMETECVDDDITDQDLLDAIEDQPENWY
ncbi:hypothetical protein HK098_001342 [Nowakowskiella sp. JEL0407]|nr:hypothetical protein HK098_001342 [Nowakowskiella sp. JEL0407]